tara:strand:+ start:103 stop:378 length:276 start_codon:yes stop_codon:yes gene_type:complete
MQTKNEQPESVPVHAIVMPSQRDQHDLRQRPVVTIQGTAAKAPVHLSHSTAFVDGGDNRWLSIGGQRLSEDGVGDLIELLTAWMLSGTFSA